ncbi:MAG: hypothetical protein PVI31_09140 [Gemmatimonadota bacterium]
MSACAEQASERLEPKVEVVDGVEIATLPPLPDLLDSEHVWSLETLREVRTVLPGVEDPILFDPTGLVVLRSGELLVHDPPADRPLVILDPDTETVLARFGSKGRGPGEVSQLLALAEAPDGTLAVFDYGNRRVHHYGLDGTSLGDVPVGATLINGTSAASPNRSAFLVETYRSQQEVWSHDLRRVDLDTGQDALLLSLPDLPEGETYSWRSGRALWASLDGGIIGMWGGETSFSVFDAGGTLVREVRLPLTKRELTDREVEDLVRRTGGRLGGLTPGPMGLTNFLFPVTDSVFGMLTGPLWHAEGDPTIPEGVQLWRLFDLSGTYVGVMNRADVMARGAGDTLWVEELDDGYYPVLKEVRLVRGGRLDLTPEGEP